MVAWDHIGTRAHTCREDAHHADTAPYVVHADGGRSLMAQHLETGAPVYRLYYFALDFADTRSPAGMKFSIPVHPTARGFVTTSPARIACLLTKICRREGLNIPTDEKVSMILRPLIFLRFTCERHYSPPPVSRPPWRGAPLPPALRTS